MATTRKPNEKELLREESIQDIKKLDDTVRQLLKQNIDPLAGGTQTSELNSIYDEFSSLVRSDQYNFMKTKTANISSYDYLTNSLMGRRPDGKETQTPRGRVESRMNLEKMFEQGDMQAASMFLNQSSDIQHICDEIESICAYLYQLDEAVLIYRDNIMNGEQQTSDLPFDITFDRGDGESIKYQKVISDVIKTTGLIQKLNDHIVPKMIKFGRYYVLTIPYSEIGVKMLSSQGNPTKNIFNYNGIGGGSVGIHESDGNIQQDTNYTTCMENVDILLDQIYTDESVSYKYGLGEKTRLRSTIESNMRDLLVNDDSTPPNVTGILESTYNGMDDELKKIVDKSMKDVLSKFNVQKFKPKSNKSEDAYLSDATVDPEDVETIPGCYIKLLDPRQIVPIKIFDHVIGYYYFENYDYSRTGTTITDLLSNQINFNDQNMIVDNIVGSVLRNLKYGDLLKGDNNFKSLILNCILFAERRQNPVRLKFVPVEYVTEFKTNCDENGNGQPVLSKSLVFGRLYTSLLLFIITSIITKSTDTEFYYLKEDLLSQSYEDQVADIIEQFRSSNIDISQIMNGNLLHGNRAINKRYFMCTGPSEQKPFDMEVISGQQIDTQTEFLTNLKKMAIGSTGIPALAVEYMDEVEFATIAKMTNARTNTRSNNIQIDLNPSITELVVKVTRYSKPNAVPEEILESTQCTLRPCNTINTNISGDELNNNIATVDNMIETFYGGQNTETPVSIEYEKEEMRKRLIMKLSSSLPWGYMESIRDEVKAQAKIKEQEAKLKAELVNNTEEA